MTCKCDFRQRMLGDGCEECNPGKALVIAKDRTVRDEALLRQALEALRELDEAWPLPVGKTAKNAIAALRAWLETGSAVTHDDGIKGETK